MGYDKPRFAVFISRKSIPHPIPLRNRKCFELGSANALRGAEWGAIMAKKQYYEVTRDDDG